MYILIDKMYILFYNQDVHLKMYLFLIIKNKGKNNEQDITVYYLVEVFEKDNARQ